MRIAESIPSACSACYGQYVTRRHIDFESSWDGPVISEGIMGENGVIAQRVPVSIDELVICEDCLSAAARMLGMDFKHAEKLKELRDAVQAAEERARGLEVHNQQMAAALASKPTRQKVAA